MLNLDIKYSTYGKATAPEAIRMKIGGWAGEDQKLVDGSEPQPWHCLPFVEASTYGLELVYRYETECRVVNENGVVRFDWDFAGEPGGGLTGGEFLTFFPKEASRFYSFSTKLDVVAPPGYVLRTEPHPRYFTDDAGTAPLAMIGHVQSEWWPKRLGVVFRAPQPGQSHVFRKGEPYAQIVFLPRDVNYTLSRMTPQVENRRRELESAVDVAEGHIADNVWTNRAGASFNSHYKVLSRAFRQGGVAGVDAAVREGFEKFRASLPTDRPVPELIAEGKRKLAEGKFDEARGILSLALSREPDNAEAMTQLAIVAVTIGSPMVALDLMTRATEVAPRSAGYRSNLGELLRMLGRYPEAEAALRESLRLAPGDAGVLSVLGLTVAQQGRLDEGERLCRQAVAANPAGASNHFRLGLVLAGRGLNADARAFYEAALARDPQHASAAAALRELPPA